MTLETKDFNDLAGLGSALWADTDQGQKRVKDTFSASVLLKVNPDRVIERTTSALVDRADRDGVSINEQALNHPFFRLIPAERFLLWALHVGHGSYDRIARVLKTSPQVVAKTAWNARLHLSSFAVKDGTSMAVYPVDPTMRLPSCPEYQPDNPWTQKFLDQETKSQENLFLKNHLMGCEDCRASLNRCRDLYFAVEKMIPVSKENNRRHSQELEQAWQFGQEALAPLSSQMTFGKSLKLFFNRREVQIGTFLLLMLMLTQIL